MPILPGQIYSGTLSRQCLPPDTDRWWDEPGSYEIVIETCGDRWIHYRSFRVHPNGLREAIQLPGEYRKARLIDVEKDVADGVLVLRRP
jgi:hypothetical protein